LLGFVGVCWGLLGFVGVCWLLFAERMDKRFVVNKLITTVLSY